MHFYIFATALVQTFLQLILKPLVWFFVNPQVTGLENIKKAGKSFILAANHIQELDVIFLPGAIPLSYLPRPIFFVSSEKKAYTRGLRGQLFYGGMLFTILGGYPAIQGIANYEKALKNQLEILRDNQIVIIYPEGRITLSGEIEDAKGGLGFLVEKTRKNTLPVLVEGIFDLSLKDFFLRKRKFKVTIGEPMSPEEVLEGMKSDGPHKYQEAAQVVIERIRSLKS